MGKKRSAPSSGAPSNESVGEYLNVDTIELLKGQTTSTSNLNRVGVHEIIGVKDEVVASLKEKLKYVAPLTRKACIIRVPKALREVNEKAYTPQLLSIGPYHQASECLKPMQEHKLRYLSDFLCRGPKHNLLYVVSTFREREEDARQHYGEIIKDDSDTFVEMMVLDACFIMELFFKFWEKKKEVMEKDPLFHIAPMLTSIRVDMLLLENQLPFFILEHLFNLHTAIDQKFMGAHFHEITLKFFNFRYLLSMAGYSTLIHSSYGINHFLDLLRECSVHAIYRISVDDNDMTEEWEFIPCATELHEAGVKFSKATSVSIFSLNFTKGTFVIPSLIIEDTTEILFRNLVAFEQCSKISREQYITHYLALMDFLINSPNDVATLRRFGIIENWLGDNEQVSLIFNKIFMGVTIVGKNFYFHKLVKDVNIYYKSPWHSFRAMLGREYFYSPWSTASSIAVIIVVISAIVQTICTVISTIK